MPRKKLAVSAEERQQILATLSSLISRREMSDKISGTQFGGQRDLYAVLGYHTAPKFGDFQAQYERGDIAARIVDAKPESTWRRRPVVSNDSDPNNFTPFEQAWVTLQQKRRVFHYLERIDKLAGIGEYGVLLLGTDDVRKEEDLAKPMATLRRGLDSLLYLAPFSQGSAIIDEIETDSASERFGLPSIYNVTISSGNARINSQQIAATKQVRIHWTRLIHVAEGLTENDYLGTPRLKPVFNRIYDIAKIAGGSAEIFWQAAKRIMVLQGKDGFTAVDSDDALTAMMDELIHGMRRVIDVQGYDVKTLDPTDVKPDEAFRVCLALVSSATGIPQRILLGSEQGKMASTQDEINWNGRIADRQLNYAEQVILRPFIDRLLRVKVLPPPGNEYTITWPSLFELSDKEKAQIGLLKARALAQYVGKAGENTKAMSAVIPVEEFRGEILNLRSMKIEQASSKSGGQADAPVGDTE